MAARGARGAAGGAGDWCRERRVAKRVRKLAGSVSPSLKEAGFIEGQTVAFEYRFAEGQFDQLPSLAADLARRQVAVMISTGGDSSLAVKNADATIPHVFAVQDDPVRLGFVQSFNRPGGHATGVSLLTAVLAGKRVEFARQIMPAGAPLAYLANPPATQAARYLREIKAVAHRSNKSLSSSMPAARPRSTLRLRTWSENARALLSSVRMGIFSAGASRSSRWRGVTRSPRSMIVATMP